VAASMTISNNKQIAFCRIQSSPIKPQNWIRGNYGNGATIHAGMGDAQGGSSPQGGNKTYDWGSNYEAGISSYKVFDK
jgi:hypothetical protein